MAIIITEVGGLITVVDGEMITIVTTRTTIVTKAAPAKNSKATSSKE